MGDQVELEHSPSRLPNNLEQGFLPLQEVMIAACRHFGADVCINYNTSDFIARMEEETVGKAAGLKNRSPEKKAEIVQEVEKRVWPAIEAGKVKPVIYKSLPLT